MRKKISDLFLTLCTYLEIVMSLMLIAVVVILGVRIITQSSSLFTGNPAELLETFFGSIMILAVGIEFVKMLLLHSTSAVIDVLVFAIARQMIIGHAGNAETLIGTIALGILFAIKHFFIDNCPKEK